MNEFVSIVGSIASFISIPLAIYLYLKSKEAKFDKIKKDIIRILSYQIGEGRTIYEFDIKTVISSKLRENRIDADAITIDQIIEDLSTEIISSPLINKEQKNSILDNLKRIYLGGDFLEKLLPEKDFSGEKVENKIIELKLKEVSHRKKLISGISKKAKYGEKLSSLFGVFTIFTGIITAIILSVGKENFDYLNNSLKENEFTLTAAVSVVISIIAGVLTFLQVKNKNNKKK